MAIKNVISVKGLCKSFQPNFWEPKRQILKKVSFDVPVNVTTGFIGINGSGKTTSLKCILGFIHPEEGSIRFFDEAEHGNAVLSRIGYLPERPYLYEYLTTTEFLKLHWELTGGGSNFKEAANSCLERVNLLGVEDRRIRYFSKGMMQRIGMAQALLRKPELLILDEPMSGLDPDGRFLIKDIIRQEKARGTTVFFSSHFLNDIEELCEYLVVIDAGQILYTGPTLNLISKTIPRYRVASRDPNTETLSEERCELDKLDQTLNSLKKAGRIVSSVSNEYVALEVAFQGLREAKEPVGGQS